MFKELLCHKRRNEKYTTDVACPFVNLKLYIYMCLRVHSSEKHILFIDR